ncbi:MAG: hypothetical protein B0D92_04195 [Spirochaeta sp. LUC14_002_19_P3]|nr:MAG: hypothetical protein B0D92_04195 [Spirochaeta sp. LUC14_002_19_P3]
MFTFSGFDSYLGFIHTENYHLNPSVNTFVAILRLQTSKSNPANNATIDCDDSSRKNQLGKEEMMELGRMARKK